jgi:gliding motility-associated-like protein
LSIAFSNQQNVSCFGGADAAVTATISGGFTPYSFTWSPSLSNTLSLTNVQAATYTISVTDAGNCFKQDSVKITQPNILQINSKITATSCAKNNGAIQVGTSGGTPNYTYVWSPAVSASANLINLAPGNYIVSISDSKNCNIKDTYANAPSVDAQIALSMGPDTCAKGRWKVQVQTLSGISPFNFIWTPGGVGTATSNALIGSEWYHVTIQDAAGCTASDSIYVPIVGLISVSLGPDRELCLDETPVTLSVPAFQQIIWQDGSNGQNYAVHETGTYSVSVMNNYGCEAHDAMMVINLCEGWMMLPNAFSPNGDGLDDTFGPIFSNAANLIQFRMELFNRWGERIYLTTDANAPWDGRFNGKEQEIGTYVYMIICRFGLDTSDRLLKGDFSIIR